MRQKLAVNFRTTEDGILFTNKKLHINWISGRLRQWRTFDRCCYCHSINNRLHVRLIWYWCWVLSTVNVLWWGKRVVWCNWKVSSYLLRIFLYRLSFCFISWLPCSPGKWFVGISPPTCLLLLASFRMRQTNKLRVTLISSLTQQPNSQELSRSVGCCCLSLQRFWRDFKY